MKFRLVFILTLSSVIAIFPGCTKEQAPTGTTTPIVLPPGGQSVISSQNIFALKFFKEVLQQDNSNSNKLISPLSIYTAFSMVYNGATGHTSDEMKTVLQLQDIPTETLNNTIKSLMTGLPKADSKIEMDIANSIWYRSTGPQPLQPFINTVSEYYLSQITKSDFNNPQTVDNINSWVTGKTHGKINRIIDQISPEDIMYLINAVYFKGQWKLKFDQSETKDMTFYVKDPGTVQVPFMTQTATFRYMENHSMQCVELPYGSGSFSMYIILPASGLSVEDLLSSFNGDPMTGTLNEMDSAKVTLYLPKWTYSYDLKDMKPEMSSLGMHDAFTENAAFYNMYPLEAGAYISKAIHKTYIAVDEKGTEAAAVTSIGMGTTSVPQNPVMNVNRPFLYLIAENHTGSVLFLGKVNDPGQQQN
ncbi:MAG: serpin family protein [Chitinophagaceae bacterium]|nr:serpin family protein [Chitinophagaceae bacterium]